MTCVRTDPHVFAFSFLVSLVTPFLFGVAPALPGSKVDQASVMKGDHAMPLGGMRGLTRGPVLRMLQVALSSWLLIGGGLFLRSMQFAQRVDPGFDWTGMKMFSVDLGLQGYDEASGRRFQKELAERLKTLPGVPSVSLAYPLPLDADNNSASIRVEGYVLRSDTENHSAGLGRVGPQYFETMGTRLIAGRPLDNRDGGHSRRAGVIKEALAPRYLETPGQALPSWRDGPSRWAAFANAC